MTERIHVAGLAVARPLYDLVRDEIAPGTGISGDRAWQGFADIVRELTPRNRALLARRDELQARIDAWHLERRGQPHDAAAYRRFLEEIGYLLPEGEDFRIATENVDDEIARIAGPQLVVPVSNARYALNAANARWGSLYDALYGTDALPEDGGATRGPGYNPVRGAKVIEYCRYVLDRTAPLKRGSHVDSTAYRVVEGQLVVGLKGGKTSKLADPAQFLGHQGDAAAPSGILLVHHG